MNKLYRLAFLLLVLAGLYAPAALAQSAATRAVSGKVTTADTKEALPGVTVLLKGTTVGTGTGPDGTYTLQVPEQGGTLVFSFVGYASKEVAINGQTTISPVLDVDAKGLDEVVVVGYGTQKAGNVTGAVTGITAKEIEERPVNRIENALVGQMPGVYVQTTTGEPGAELQIRVRGAASINASNDPLYVVDGVPVDNLRGINPTDVANIEVLKDAASAAIYGSRGSNGVVLVTTKRGKKGAAKLQFSGYTGVQLAESRLKVQSAEEWIQMRKEGIDIDWVNQNPALNRPEDSRATRLQRLTVNGTPPSQTNVIRYTYDPKWQYGQDSLDYVDWQKAIFRRAIMQQYTVGVSGGTDNVTYNVNGSFLNQNGIILGSDLQRATLRANIDAQIRKGIKLFMTLAPSMEWSSLGRVDGTGGQALNAAQMPPVSPKGAGIYAGADPYFTYNYSGRYISPVAVMERTDANGTRTRLNANMGLNLDLYKGFQLQLLGAMDNGYFQDQIYTPTNASRDWVGAAPGSLSTSRYSQTFNTRYLFQSVLNYTRSFGDHSLNAILGYSVERTKVDFSQQENGQLPNDQTYLFDRANSTVNRSYITAGKEALLSYFARAQYDYKQRYLLSASIRRDGSSKFGANRPFGYFPAVSAGWRISGENFMQGVTFISDLKARASWGVTGNNRIPNDSQFSLLGVSNYSLGGASINGYAPIGFQNRDLGWEQTASWNYGLDFSVLNNRLQVTADYYTKQTTDLLYQVPLSSLTGFTRTYVNIGQVYNQGVELGLTSRNVVGAFEWTTNFNASYNKNRVEKLDYDDTPVPTGSSPGGFVSLLQVGLPINSYYLYDAIGVYQTQAEVDNEPKLSNTRVGDIKYRDVNGDGKITDADRTIMGNPTPKYIFGVTNTFRYKGFDLNVLVNAQQGAYLYSLIGRSIDRPGMGYLYNHASNWNNRWKSEAEPGDGKTPSITAQNSSLLDSRWLYKSDYIRLKNITLGYTLPKARFYNGARLYVALENAYIWHNYTGGFSPEALQLGGFDNGSYPQARTYTLGFNLTL
ncbi:SusC/RagA family TonB-linked outer membrane protein [Hymenobacter armeniacus]|uniref:TonB-dependent receptor n=1 Tax=Hymenobacter armeniacus TaxID=2771358 RepID=A0ABR8JTX8_9BACT|nr:TonB-dependent receptor [Hymenobacter armeniacus]MBD2722065.1 TonB-dependent receptor [Hymenobacter armeniacus]